ncbi:hypothetical protein [Verrucomicrobium sp. BvORR106]|uniref:hypothetical protein n=1 Tax=Verrucomicrobium sp. BvORR106 TaxID=1403819 RepID=UPI00056E0614|nr:hypothetical protein [Verrucomicrobium sp. BvORR106]
MNLEKAFELVNNLDYKESHRRFAPQHGLLLFDSSGEVVSIYRFKTTPHEAEHIEALAKHPRCLQISTMPNWFATPAELKARIDGDLWLFSHMKPRPPADA